MITGEVVFVKPEKMKTAGRVIALSQPLPVTLGDVVTQAGVKEDGTPFMFQAWARRTGIAVGVRLLEGRYAELLYQEAGIDIPG